MTKCENNPKLNIGIDIGAARIVVAFCEEVNSRPLIVIDANQQRMTPTCVAFVDHQILLASAADTKATAYPEAVISGRDIKLVLGEQEIPQINPIYFPHKIIHHKNVGIAFEVEYNGTSIQIFPEQVIAMLLKFLKENIAKQYPDYEIGKCVITVPSVYDNAKASALINACVAAGFDQNEVDIITSSMAAALTYFMERYKCTEHKRVMVFDMGATTLDYTVVSIKESELSVELSGGEVNLGGDQFTMRLVEHFLKEFNKIERTNIEQDKQAMIRLRRECDKIKEKLFLCNDAKSLLGAFHNSKDFEMHITRNQFENICADLIDQIFAKLDAIAKPKKVDDIIVIGGGQRISVMQERFKTDFKNSKFFKPLNEDDAAAIGAAYYATKLGLIKEAAESKLSSLNISHKTSIQRKITINQVLIDYIRSQFQNNKSINPQITSNQLSFKEKIYSKENVKSDLGRNVKRVEANSKLENQRKKLTVIENLIKQSDYNGALRELNSIIRVLNEDLDDENIIFSVYMKRAEVQKLMGLNIKAEVDYNHILESNRFSSRQKEIKMEQDQIEKKLLKVTETNNQSKQPALQGNQMASAIDTKTDKIEQCATEIRTNAIKAKLKLCEDLCEQKQFGDSLNLLNDIDLRHIKDIYLMFELLFRKTLTLFGCHEFEEALIQCDKALDLEKNMSPIVRSILEQKINEIRMKREEINKELAMTKITEILNRCKEIAQNESQKSIEIDRYFKKLISKLDVNVLEGYKAYIYYECAKIYFDFEHYIKSIELANMGIQNQKGDDILFNIIGECYYKLGDFDEAKLNFVAAYSLNPTDEQLKNKIERITKENDRKIVRDKLESFEVLWVQGEYEESLEILETIDLNQITDILLKFVVLQRKALTLLSCKRYDEALNNCNEALELEETVAKVQSSQLYFDYDIVQMIASLYFMMGNCYFHLGDFEKAKRALQRAQTLENSSETNEFLEKCNQNLIVNKQLEASNRFFNEKNYKQALKELQNVDLNKISEFNLKMKVFYEKARSYYSLKEEKDALIQCEEAIKIYNANHYKDHGMNCYEAIQIQLIHCKLQSIAAKCYFKEKNDKHTFVDFEIAHTIHDFNDQPYLKAVAKRLEFFEKLFSESKYDLALKLLKIIDVGQIVENDVKHKVIISLAKAYCALGKKEKARKHCDQLPTGVFEDEVKLICCGKTELKVRPNFLGQSSKHVN